MEKINYYKHEPDLIDGLLAITDSARRILLAMKRSRSLDNSLTLEEFTLVNSLGNCSRRNDVERISDYQARRILTSIIKNTNRSN